MQARHPYELGGLYFTFTILTTPLVCLYFGTRYLAFVEDSADDETFVLRSFQVYVAIRTLATLSI